MSVKLVGRVEAIMLFIIVIAIWCGILTFCHYAGKKDDSIKPVESSVTMLDETVIAWIDRDKFHYWLEENKEVRVISVSQGAEQYVVVYCNLVHCDLVD